MQGNNQLLRDSDMSKQSPTQPEISVTNANSVRNDDDDTLAPAGKSVTESATGFGPPVEPGEVGTLGPYRIVKELGKGGMGAVYAAIDTRLERQLALKVMLPEYAANAAAKERFLREARAAAKISHDNVVTVYEADERQGVPYIAMQYLEGYPLDGFLKKKGNLSIPQVLRIAMEAAAGLAAAHKIGLVHRDIKPGNLWLEAPNGRVKVLDFGLAKPMDSEVELTKSGAIVGTPAYMSPEQARGEKVDARTDLFSLGVLMYRLCTGKLPFHGPNTMAVLMALATEEPTPVRELNPNVSESLAELTHQLLAKKADARPQSAVEVVKRVRAISQEQSASRRQLVQRPTSQPQVVYVPIQVTAVQQENPFADIADSMTEGLSVEAAIAPTNGVAPSRKKPGGQWLLVAAGFAALAMLVLGVGFIIIKITNKDGSITELKVPDDSKIEVNGKPVVPEAKKPEVNKPTVISPSTHIWTPIPVGESPFDKLDPNAIPKEERFDWQPKELVGVIGSHARRHWASVASIAFSPDGNRVATGSSGTEHIIIWDMKKQAVERNIPVDGNLLTVATSLHFSTDGQTLTVGMIGGTEGVRRIFLNGPQSKWQPIKVDGKEMTEWGHLRGRICSVLESGKTFLTHSTRANETVSLFDWNNGEPKLTVDKFAVKGYPAVASAVDLMFYADKDGKIHRATVKNAKFENDKELPISLGAEGWLKAVTPDGKKVVIWADKQTQVWDVSHNPPKLVHRIPEQVAVGGESACAISPDGKWLLSKNSPTALFRLEGEEPKRLIWLDQTDVAGYIGDLVFSPDSTKVIIGNDNGLVRFWDLSGKEPKELSPFDPSTAFPIPHWDKGTSLDRTSGRLMVPRFDRQEGKWNRFQLYDFASPSPQPQAMLDSVSSGPVLPISQNCFVQIAPQHSQISQLYRQKDSGFKPIGEPFGSPNTLGNVSPDGRTMVVYSPRENPKQLEAWDLTGDAPKQKWSITAKDQQLLGGVYGCKVWYSADDRWFATQAKGEKEGGTWKLVLWRNTGAKPEVHATIPIAWHVGHYRAAFSPDGRYLAHMPDDPNVIVILDLNSKQPREVARYTDGIKLGYVSTLVFHPDSKKLACGSDRSIGILDIARMKSIWDWPSPGPIHWLDWAADGRHLITHNGNLTCYVLRMPESVVGKAPLAVADPDRKAAE